MNLYLASRFSRQFELREYAKAFVAAGHTITSRWVEHHPGITDETTDEERRMIALEDVEDVKRSDYLVLFTEPAGDPANKGSGHHTEFGIFYALNIPILIVGPRENLFHYLPGVYQVGSVESAVEYLQYALSRAPITEEWLRAIGFKWHQFDRQSSKQWLLWLGSALVEPYGYTDAEDFGIELSHEAYAGPDKPKCWFCWVRCDSSHRYHRFMHVRHLVYRDELISMIEGLTGRAWAPELAWCGAMVSPEKADWLRREHDRLDKRIHREQHSWMPHEKDGDRGRPLPEHIDAAIKGGLAK